MSAASLYQAGQGAKGLAIAALVVAAGLGLLWLIKNREKFDPTSDKNVAYQAASGLTETLTGVEGDTVGTAVSRGVETLTSAVKEIFSSEPAYFDEKQALATCRVIYASKGVVTAPICQELIAKYGP